MFVFVRSPALPSRTARSLRPGLIPAHRGIRQLLEARARLDGLGVLDACDWAAGEDVLDDTDPLGCCGCVPPDASRSDALPPPWPDDPAFGNAPTPLPPPPPDNPRSSSGLPSPLALEALERRLYLRIGALEAHVDALGGALARRDAADRARRSEGERAATQSEERALAALVELLSFAWREWRAGPRRAPRGT